VAAQQHPPDDTQELEWRRTNRLPRGKNLADYTGLTTHHDTWRKDRPYVTNTTECGHTVILGAKHTLNTPQTHMS
jgi:hypothetical protein